MHRESPLAPKPALLISGICVTALLGVGVVALSGGNAHSRVSGSPASLHGVDSAPAAPSDLDRLVRQVQVSPTDTASLSRLALRLESLDRIEEAGRYYRQLLVVSRSDPGAWRGLGRVYWALENWDAAAEAWRAVLSARPRDPEAMYGLGAIAARRGDLRGAERWWRRVMQSDGDVVFVERATASLVAIRDAGARWEGDLPRP